MAESTSTFWGSEEDKPTLARKRAELVEILNTPMSTEDLVRVQGELSVINAKIKALNTITAAQNKTTADRRKAAGLAEAQANALRARARINSSAHEPEKVDDDDPGQTAVIDGWIDAVLLRHDVDFARDAKGALIISRGALMLSSDPLKLAATIELLVTGIYTAARGQELPDLPRTLPRTPPEELKAPKVKPKKR